MTIQEAQTKVDEWIKKYGVRYFNELTNTAILMEEVGEVARIMARRYGEQSEKESDKTKNLGDEMADVLFVLICLANQTGVDLNEAFRIATRNTIEFLHRRAGLDPLDAYSLASIGVSFRVTQFVNQTRGVHALSPKALFSAERRRSISIV